MQKAADMSGQIYLCYISKAVLIFGREKEPWAPRCQVCAINTKGSLQMKFLEKLGILSQPGWPPSLNVGTPKTKKNAF